MEQRSYSLVEGRVGSFLRRYEASLRTPGRREVVRE